VVGRDEISLQSLLCFPVPLSNEACDIDDPEEDAEQVI